MKRSRVTHPLQAPMQVRISVSPGSEPGESGQFVFEKDRVTIGRDVDCDLVLTDPKRIVSKEHVALERVESGYAVVDLGSKNFTFLNGEKLVPGEARVVATGDAIRIGDYELSLAMIDIDAPRDDRTVFLLNPFDVATAQLAGILDKFESLYEGETPGRRDEALKQAMGFAFGERSGPAHALVARILADGAAGEPESASREATPVLPAGVREHPDLPRGDPGRESANRDDSSSPRFRPSKRTSGESTERDRYGRVFDALMAFVPRILGLPWRFRHEFIGQTIMHSPDAAALFDGDADGVRRFMLDDTVTEAEFERRLSLLVDAAEDVVMHGIAMVDGYKGAAQEGVARLASEINPAKLEADLRASGRLLDRLPVLLEMRLLGRIRGKLDQLGSDDWTVSERRIYRPAFIKAYLARMTSRHRESGR